MIAYFLNILFTIIEYAILLDVIMSLILQNKTNKYIELLHVITEPFMRPGRMLQEKLIPNLMIDFSPIFALLIIAILRRLVSVIF